MFNIVKNAPKREDAGLFLCILPFQKSYLSVVNNILYSARLYNCRRCKHVDLFSLERIAPISRTRQDFI